MVTLKDGISEKYFPALNSILIQVFKHELRHTMTMLTLLLKVKSEYQETCQQVFNFKPLKYTIIVQILLICVCFKSSVQPLFNI